MVVDSPAIARDELIEDIRRMPEAFTLDELVRRIVLLQAIDAGQRDADEGRVVSSAEARAKV